MLAHGHDRSFPRGFTLTELLVASALLVILATLAVGGGQQALRSASLAVSANNIRQLAAGAGAYLGDNNYTFWRYREMVLDGDRRGVRWWFGFEPQSSLNAPEGTRIFYPEDGPLGGYLPASLRPDPSFRHTGKAFKPKYRFGYLGVGYNVLLGGGWSGGAPLRYFQLAEPERTVVFATSAQVNTFQAPASPANPMIEEFYGLDQREVTVHFRHGRSEPLAMVAYASGSVGFLPMDESTRDSRAPQANVGRFAPAGSTRYLR